MEMYNKAMHSKIRLDNRITTS